MRIVVFGATGRTGRPLVEQALERGHDVAAFVRTPGRLEAHPRLTEVQGDALDAEAVSRSGPRRGRRDLRAGAGLARSSHRPFRRHHGYRPAR